MLDQSTLEETFSSTKIHEEVMDAFLSEDTGMDIVVRSIALLEAWANLPAEYQKKQERKDTLKEMDLSKIVHKVVLSILVMLKPQSIANTSSQLAATFGFADSKQSVSLAAEIITVMAHSGLYSILRKRKGETYYIIPNVFLPRELLYKVSQAMYMPPLIEKPVKVERNSDSAYHTIENDSLILKPRFNYHNDNIALDVINMQNNIALSLNEEFIMSVPENPTFEMGEIKGIELLNRSDAQRVIQMQKESWDMHIELTQYTEDLMLDNGNKFYIPNKVDKRGRLYAQGHYINPIGTSYKKAAIDFHHKETITVPKDYFNESN